MAEGAIGFLVREPLSLATSFKGNGAAFQSSLCGAPILIAAVLIAIYSS